MKMTTTSTHLLEISEIEREYLHTALSLVKHALIDSSAAVVGGMSTGAQAKRKAKISHHDRMIQELEV